MPVTVAVIMKSNPSAVVETMHMGTVEAEMRIADVRHLIIVDEHGRLSGIVSRGDIMRALEKGARGPVSEHMTRRVYSVKADDYAVKAVDIMIERNVGAVPVIDDDEKPVGIVSETALLQRARDYLAAVP